MKVRITSRCPLPTTVHPSEINGVLRNVQADGTMEVPDDTASFLRAIEPWGRFVVYMPGQTESVDPHSADGGDPDLITLHFENDYD